MAIRFEVGDRIVLKPGVKERLVCEGRVGVITAVVKYANDGSSYYDLKYETPFTGSDGFAYQYDSWYDHWCDLYEELTEIDRNPEAEFFSKS